MERQTQTHALTLWNDRFQKGQILLESSHGLLAGLASVNIDNNHCRCMVSIYIRNKYINPQKSFRFVTRIQNSRWGNKLEGVSIIQKHLLKDD